MLIRMEIATAAMAVGLLPDLLVRCGAVAAELTAPALPAGPAK